MYKIGKSERSRRDAVMKKPLRNGPLTDAAIMLAASLAVLGCSNAAISPVQASSAQTEISAPRASRIAQALAEAEEAHETGRNESLVMLVNSLRASGLSLRDEGGVDMLDTWSRAAGIEATPFRGRLLGPAYVRGELAPGEVWRSAQTFKSGVPSTLAVSHRGAGPVRIKVSDQSSRPVCSPASSREPQCRFTPLYTQRYEIELVNEGAGRAVYFLVFD
jgi:hypothetical protein